MQVAIAVFLIVLGAGLFWMVLRLLSRVLDRAQTWSETTPGPRTARFTGEEPVGPEGVLYLYATDFVAPPPRRPMGSVPRDRAFACGGDEELCPDDFARQLLYAVLVDLHEQGCLETKLVEHSPSFMPPFPQKQWEMQLRQCRAFPGSPLASALGVGLELCRRQRQRNRKTEELLPEDEFFTFDEILERSLKSLRAELTFWQRGTVCSDLRRHVEESLIAGGYLRAPAKETWVEKLRTQQPTPNPEAIAELAEEAAALRARLEAFRRRHGSPAALEPVMDEKGKRVDYDQALVNTLPDLETAPFDDCLRLTIHEAIAALKQLEPSGEAGI